METAGDLAEQMLLQRTVEWIPLRISGVTLPLALKGKFKKSTKAAALQDLANYRKPETRVARPSSGRASVWGDVHTVTQMDKKFA